MLILIRRLREYNLNVAVYRYFDSTSYAKIYVKSAVAHIPNMRGHVEKWRHKKLFLHLIAFTNFKRLLMNPLDLKGKN